LIEYGLLMVFGKIRASGSEAKRAIREGVEGYDSFRDELSPLHSTGPGDGCFKIHLKRRRPSADIRSGSDLAAARRT